MSKTDISTLQLNNLGHRLRAVRKTKGITNYGKWCYEHDLAPSQYGRYERGGDIQFSTLAKIISAFGMTIPEFFAEGFD